MILRIYAALLLFTFVAPAVALPDATAAESAAPRRLPHRVAWVDYDGEVPAVQVKNLRSSSITTVYEGESSPQNVHLSRSGRLVAWTYYGGEPVPSNRIMLAASDGSGSPRNILRRVAGRFEFIDSVDFGPRDRRVAFIARTTRDRINLYSIRRDGRRLRLLARNVGGCGDNCGHLVWSQNGGKIGWAGWTSRDWTALNLRTGRRSALPDGFFGWSPNEKWVGLQRNYGVRLIRKPVGGGSARLIARRLPSTCGGAEPIWAADNRIVVDGQDQLIRVNLRGNREILLEDACTKFDYR
ncbi:hypothetical protein [Nocardioides pelophilus]|uniref:hypothetical protein n=1 Tax=Nocardioides pelophilus TaxID=2172019 RepID=UPI0016005BA6|nr:hypothetical protein [Nocardioides pelophilus]